QAMMSLIAFSSSPTKPNCFNLFPASKRNLGSRSNLRAFASSCCIPLHRSEELLRLRRNDPARRLDSCLTESTQDDGGWYVWGKSVTQLFPRLSQLIGQLVSMGLIHDTKRCAIPNI